MLDGQLKDYEEKATLALEHPRVRTMNKLNWSYGIKTSPYPFSIDSTPVENLSDFDCIAINLALSDKDN